MGKKIISLILVALTAISTVAFSASAKSSVCAYGHGDINCDGSVSMLDVTMLQKYIASIITFNEDEKFFSDVTGDGIVKMNDVTDIQKYIADIITTFDACATEGLDIPNGTLTIGDKEYKTGDEVTYRLSLVCDEGDIAGIHANILYDNSLLTLTNYSFPVMKSKNVEPTINNNRHNSQISFVASTVNSNYGGLDFSSSAKNNVVVELKFAVNNIYDNKKTSINYEIVELFKLSQNGFVDFYYDNMRVPGYENTVKFSYEIN